MKKINNIRNSCYKKMNNLNFIIFENTVPRFVVKSVIINILRRNKDIKQNEKY